MEDLLIYLLKSAAILSIFFLVYRLLLSNEGGFSANRKFLISGIAATFLLPFIVFTRRINLPAHAVNSNYNENLNPVAATASSFEIWDILFLLYVSVCGFLLLRFGIQLISLIRLIISSKPDKNGAFYFIETQNKISPFSFFHFIFYNPKLYNQKELKLMLCHEKIHARQWHSTDILLAQITSCILWFNPISWLYKKNITQNLEFIADQASIQALGEKTTYQQTLVKAAVTHIPPALTNNFHQSFIKKRILMLNKSPNHPQKAWKMSLVFPLILAFLLSFNVKTEARIIPSATNSSTATFELEQQILEAHFSQNTTQKDLDNYQSRFAKNKINLEWENIDFKGGKLKKLHLKYTPSTGDSKEFKSKTDKNGKLVPFKIAAEFRKNGKVIFTAASSKIPGTAEITQPVTKEIAKEKAPSLPEYIIYKIEGKEVSKSKVDALDPDEIKSINVLKGEKATAKTNKRVDGIIEIKLKEEEKTEKRTGNIFIRKHRTQRTITIAKTKHNTPRNPFVKKAEDIIAIELPKVEFPKETPIDAHTGKVF